MKKARFIFLVYFTSCGDCYREATGIVVDSITKQPIENVYYQNIEKKVCTDSTTNDGKFYLSDVSGGLFDCPNIKVLFKKNGYKMKMIEIPNFVDTVILLEQK
ncbi:MAG TPA: hypothetical protein DCQ31_15360 [Bacteroidales bacterium]|nr:hypothetical protein [Bacteroidales bacterium]